MRLLSMHWHSLLGSLHGCALRVQAWMVVMDEGEFDALLRRYASGEEAAGDRLYEMAYAELKRIAHRSLASIGRGDQINTTMLVNECYLKIAGSAAVAENRTHFLALCARAMRQIIVDSARRQLADKRSGNFVDLQLVDELHGSVGYGPESITAIDQVLESLAAREPRLARIAECRLFSEMGNAEIATALNITERTVQRDWVRIKAMLTLALIDQE